MTRMMTRVEALAALELSGKYHRGEVSLPLYVTSKKIEVEDAVRCAELFLTRTGAVDEGMVHHAVQLKLELDAMYCRWTQEYTEGLVDA